LFEHEFSQTGLQPVRVEIHQDSLLEVGIENNSFPGAVLVLENKAAVKVISDELSWEGRYLVQAAERDERFEVTYLYKGSDLRKNRDVVSLGSELENCQVLCLINNGKLNFYKNLKIELIDRYVVKWRRSLLFRYNLWQDWIEFSQFAVRVFDVYLRGNFD